MRDLTRADVADIYHAPLLDLIYRAGHDPPAASCAR